MIFEKIKIYIVRKKTFDKKFKQKVLTFDLKDFLLISIYLKCIFWRIFKEIVENIDLFMKNLEDFIFCKYICKIYNVKIFSKKCDLVTYLVTQGQTDS